MNGGCVDATGATTLPAVPEAAGSAMVADALMPLAIGSAGVVAVWGKLAAGTAGEEEVDAGPAGAAGAAWPEPCCVFLSLRLL